MQAAKELFDKFEISKAPLNHQFFCHVRDYAVVKVTIDNAARAGCSANMTLAELEKAKFQKKKYIIFVLNYHIVLQF